VLLRWRAIPSSFEVERSADGSRFEVIGTLPPGPAGASAYTFRDEQPPSGVAYYRVVQRFESGGERASPVLKVGVGQTELPAVALEGTYPNPFRSVTTVSVEVRREAQLTASVWDVSGQRVATLADRVHPPGSYQFAFDGSNLPSGTYFVRVEADGRVLSHTMVLAK
jgi:hypothetical protein